MLCSIIINVVVQLHECTASMHTVCVLPAKVKCVSHVLLLLLLSLLLLQQSTEHQAHLCTNQ
jgi:hypothetical protein